MIRFYLIIIFTCAFGLFGKSQCSDPIFQGYVDSNNISTNQAYRIFTSDLASINNCNARYQLRSMHLQIVKSDEVLFDITVNGIMSPEVKKKVIQYIKPGITILVQSIKAGNEGRFVPNVIFTIK